MNGNPQIAKVKAKWVHIIHVFYLGICETMWIYGQGFFIVTLFSGHDHVEAVYAMDAHVLLPCLADAGIISF